MQGGRADTVAASVLLDLLETIEATTPGAIVGEDPDQVHDFRVAVRRSRTVIKGLSGVFPPAAAERFMADFKWLQQLTNPMRDLDVLLLDIDAADDRLTGDLMAVKRSLTKRRTAERRKLKRGLTSARFTKLLSEWRGFLESLPELSTEDRPDAERPIKKVAGARITDRYKKLVKHGKAAKRERSPESIHDLRKRAKDLRYFLAFFADLYPNWAVKPLRSDLKALHSVLGGFQDRVVQEKLLHETADELIAADSPAPPLLAIGALLNEMARAQSAAEKDFAEALASFSAKKRRAIVKSEFH